MLLNQGGSRHRWLSGPAPLDLVIVLDDATSAPYTVAWRSRRLQIPPHPARAHFVRARVRMHEYGGSELALFQGPRCLVRWPSAGPTASRPSPGA